MTGAPESLYSSDSLGVHVVVYLGRMVIGKAVQRQGSFHTYGVNDGYVGTFCDMSEARDVLVGLNTERMAGRCT
jgi:hypothetical protein